jgi:hypothetical protein
MSLDRPRNQFDGELAALQGRREMESLSASTVSSVLSSVADAISQFGVPGAGLFAKALKSGQTPVEKVVEQLENGAYAEIARIRRHDEEQDGRLEEHDSRFREFEVRLQSQEAQSAYFSAVLHGLRTSDPKKQSRIGALTINCVYKNDLNPESLDGMMRAAAELRDHDVQVLGSIYKMQISQLTPAALQAPYVNRLNNLNGMWMNWWKGDGACYLRDEGMAYRSSCIRLQTVGFIASIGSNSILDGPSKINYELLLEGKKFYERLQEVGTAI